MDAQINVPVDCRTPRADSSYADTVVPTVAMCIRQDTTASRHNDHSLVCGCAALVKLSHSGSAVSLSVLPCTEGNENWCCVLIRLMRDAFYLVLRPI